MEIDHVKPERFFFEKSFCLKHPNFKKIKSKYKSNPKDKDDSVTEKGRPR